MGIPHKNPGINAIPNQEWQPKKTASQYTGVSWNTASGKWHARIYLQGRRMKSSGYFNDELDAAKRVNQLCEEFGIPHKNHGIGTITSQEVKQTSSQYTGISWSTANKKWRAKIYFKGKTKSCGYFDDELDAAKQINKLCEEFRIPHKNYGIGTLINQQHGNNQIYDSEHANPVFSSGIPDAEDDGENKNKRNDEKDFISMNDNSPVEKYYYFYDNYLN